MAKKHKMTAGAGSGVGRLEKIGRKPKRPTIQADGEESPRRADRKPRK